MLAVLGLILKAAGSPSITWHPAVIALYGLNAAGLVWTGMQLPGRSRSAWHGGLFICIAPLLAAASGHGVLTQGIFAVVSLGLLWSVRREFE